MGPLLRDPSTVAPLGDALLAAVRAIELPVPEGSPADEPTAPDPRQGAAGVAPLAPLEDLVGEIDDGRAHEHHHESGEVRHAEADVLLVIPDLELEGVDQ